MEKKSTLTSPILLTSDIDQLNDCVANTNTRRARDAELPSRVVLIDIILDNQKTFEE